MPGPWSLTTTHTWQDSTRVCTRTVVLGGENFNALEIKLSRIYRVAAGSALAQCPAAASVLIRIRFLVATA